MALFMRNKMITLCPTTYEYAKKMPNFSHWVRMKMMEEIVIVANESQSEPKKVEIDCPNCELKGDHFCRPMGMFVSRAIHRGA